MDRLSMTTLAAAKAYTDKHGGGGGGGTSNYNALENKPQINGTTLSGNKTGADLGLASSTDIPTKTSDLTNDSNFVADASYVHTDNNYDATAKGIVDGVTAELADKADVSDVPTKTSDLTNDSGFIANTVNNLVNYYLKSETYTKSEVDAIVGAISTLHFEAVSVLPSENIQTNVIYLVPKSTAQTDNVKDEYINLDGTSYGWELIGSTEIDLSNYVTTTALNTALADYVTSTGLATILADYATTSAMNTALAGKADNATTLAGYGITDAYTKSAVDTALAGKVDAVNGKGLSTNDYSNADKAIVDGVTSALAGKADASDIPTKISDLTNDSDFIETSSTAGLMKNDGTVDTTSYATASSVSAITDGQSIDSFSDVESALADKADTSDLTSYVQKSQTAGLLKNDGTVDTNSYDTIIKTRYSVSYSMWSSSPNADGYYTRTITLNPTINTDVAPNVYLTGSGSTPHPDDIMKQMYSYVERCYLSGSTLTLYAKTKPTATFYIYVEGVAGSGSGSIVGNVIQPNGASGGGITYSTTETLTGDKWIDGKSIYRKVVDLEYLPNSSNKDVNTGISGTVSRFIRHDFTAYHSSLEYELPMPFISLQGSGDIRISFQKGNNNNLITITTNSDRSTWKGYAILEYTKV